MLSPEQLVNDLKPSRLGEESEVLGLGKANWTRVQSQPGPEKSLPLRGSQGLRTGKEGLLLRRKVRSGMGRGGGGSKRLGANTPVK